MWFFSSFIKEKEYQIISERYKHDNVDIYIQVFEKEFN